MSHELCSLDVHNVFAQNYNINRKEKWIKRSITKNQDVSRSVSRTLISKLYNVLSTNNLLIVDIKYLEVLGLRRTVERIEEIL